MGRTMILYHGINIANIKILEPKQADHDRPCVYMTTFEIVSSFYLCNAVERPYYLFPYGFTKENIPIYHELYPKAYYFDYCSCTECGFLSSVLQVDLSTRCFLCIDEQGVVAWHKG